MILGEISFSGMIWAIHDGEIVHPTMPELKAKVKILKVQDPGTKMVVNICFSSDDIAILKQVLS